MTKLDLLTSALLPLDLDIAVARALGYQVRDGSYQCRLQCVGPVTEAGDTSSSSSARPGS